MAGGLGAVAGLTSGPAQRQMADDPLRLAATEIARRVRARRLLASDVVAASLARLAAVEPELNTMVHVDADGVRAQASEIDRLVESGRDPGPLAGVPITVKDLIAVQGLPMTFGSRLHADAIASVDAVSVARLRAAGACIVGKSTTSEFGSKAVGDSPLSGRTANPWHLQRTPGGSSAGAAAGVAAAIVPVALGTDGGGSLRIPASFCGVIGFKASHGRVPVWPAAATPSLAHVGPIARCVDDIELLLTTLAGSDERDAASLAYPASFAGSRSKLQRPTIAVCTEFRHGSASNDVRGAVEAAAAVLADRLDGRLRAWEGLPVDPVDAWRIAFYGSVARRLGVFDAADPEREDRLDPLLAQQIRRIRQTTAAEQDAAGGARRLCASAIDALFGGCELLVLPSTPCTAFAAGLDAPPAYAGTGAVEWSCFTYPFNLTGHPAVSYPFGQGGDGMPIGVQIVARKGGESDLLDAMRALERAGHGVLDPAGASRRGAAPAPDGASG